MNMDDYEKVAEFDTLDKYERTVKTPGHPDDEKECREVVYVGFDRYWRVRRVSTIGWGVTEYDNSGEPLRRSADSVGSYYDEKDDAHTHAREWVEEIANGVA